MNITVPDYESYFHLNGFEHRSLPILTKARKYQIEMAQWGLIPTWAKDTSIAAKTLNAVSETAFYKASFKDSMQHSRCLIWVDGFFEWQHQGKNIQPYFIHFSGGRPFALGGLYSEWRNPLNNEIIPTCSILTTEANALMSSIHNTKKRMPLLLEKDYWDLWFNAQSSKMELQKIMKPYPDGLLQAIPISDRITQKNKDSNVPEVQWELKKNTLF